MRFMIWENDMESKTYIEENNYYKIDCTDAVWSTDRIHDDFRAAGTNLIKRLIMLLGNTTIACII